METNITKTASSSESKKSTKRKAANGKARAGKTAKRAAKTASGKSKRTRAAKGSTVEQAPELTPEQRMNRIAVAAYYLAEQRSFAPHGELDDWLTAERSL